MKSRNNMNKGWICPRCGRVNAPFTPYCDCKISISNITPNPNQCDHNWIPNSISTSGTCYRCTKCGQTKTQIYNPEHYVVTITN